MISGNPGSSGTLRVLVVDDEQEFVATLVKRLAKRGLACAAAFTGAEAIATLKETDFEVVLLDMKLPDADGNDVLREVKRLRPEIRVVILTGHISAQDGMTGLDEGASEYLMKPVEFESLLEALISAGLAKAA